MTPKESAVRLRQRIVGIRDRLTSKKESAWSAANRAAWTRIFAVGFVLLFTGLATSTNDMWPRYGALVASCTLTVTAAAEGWFKWKEYFLIFTNATSKLNRVLARLDLLESFALDKSTEVPDSEINALHNDYQTVLDALDGSWIEIGEAREVANVPKSAS